MRKFLRVLFIVLGLACIGMFGFELNNRAIRDFTASSNAFADSVATKAGLNAQDIQITEQQTAGDSVIVWFKTPADDSEWYAHFQKSLFFDQYKLEATDYGTRPATERFYITDTTGEYYVFPDHSRPPEFFFRGNPALKNTLIIIAAWLVGGILFLIAALTMSVNPPKITPQKAARPIPKKEPNSAIPPKEEPGKARPPKEPGKIVPLKPVPKKTASNAPKGAPKRKLTLADLDDLDIENIDLDDFDLSDLNLDEDE